MFSRQLTMAALGAAIALAPASRAVAGADDVIGGIIGGVIGNAISNDVRRKRQRRTVVHHRRSSGQSATRTRQVRRAQTSLNYFGFQAGPVDGDFGARTASAISRYQGFMGYPVTGRLEDHERAFLTTSYTRAQAGGAATSQLVASLPNGTRGLLKRYRKSDATGTSVLAGAYGGLPPKVAAAVEEIARNSEPTANQLMQRSGFVRLADLNEDGRNDYLLDTSATGSSFWCKGEKCAVRVFASTPDGYARNDFLVAGATPASFTCQQGDCELTGEDESGTSLASAPGSGSAPEQAAPEGGTGALPNLFRAEATTGPSLASHCNKVSLLTSSNGGFTRAGAMDDPDFALNEQFCLARTYAIAEGEELAKRVSGASSDEIAAQCRALGKSMKPYVSALSLKPREEVVRRVSSFVLDSGMAPDQLAGTAKICLSFGYRTDDMPVALGAALVLVTVGEPAYGELLGHHLSQGFGATKRADLALAWYDQSLDAVDKGAEAVFAPDRKGRRALIRKAAHRIGGGSAGEDEAVVEKAALPTFSIEQ